MNEYLIWYLYEVMKTYESQGRNFVQRSFGTIEEAWNEGHYLARQYGEGWKVKLYEVRANDDKTMKLIYRATFEY